MCLILNYFFQDTPNLYVNQQEITASEGGSVTVICHYKYSTERKWCRLGRTCVTDQSGSIDETAVTINASVSNVFTVTMSELRTESSGWYWCATRDLQMPVHVTVNKLPSITMSPSTASKIQTIFYSHKLVTRYKGNTNETLIYYYYNYYFYY